MPQATSVIGHGIRRAGDIVVARNIAMRPLVECPQAQEVRPRGGGRGRTFGGPALGRPIVAIEPDGSLCHVAVGA